MAKTNIPSNSIRRFRLDRLCLSVAACLALQPVQAAVSIATSPLLTDSSVDPNIMFVLDDSGSMQWEIMPDNITFFAYLFPIPSVNGGSAMYGASEYSSQIPNYNSNNFYNFFLRSPHNNLVFYNPAIEYSPWQRYVGSSTVPVTGDASGNINPNSAPFNPAAAGRGTLNLDPTAAISRRANWWSNGTGGCSGNMDCSIWPMTFYMYNGGGANVNSQSSYTRYQIRNGRAYRATNSGAGAEVEVTSLSWTAADGSTITRTVAAERQNFANWFSYYRSRLLAARGGASLAFSDLGDGYRVGFTTINHRGEASYTFKIPTTGGFSATSREGWFDKLLDTDVSTNGTPLRRALQWAGEYYSKSQADADNPWKPFDEAECRRSFSILTTDGYWNGPTPSPSVGNSDGSNGAVHTSHLDDVADSGYVSGPPYADAQSNTLADVAMHYWKNDLQGASDNKVKPTTTDKAFWQHMNTFTLSIGVQGTLDPATVLADLNFANWPNPHGGGEATIDDLLHAAMNGRGNFVPARDPEEFAKGLSDALKAITDTAGSASSLSGNTTSVTTGSTVFQAKFAAGNWAGDLVAWGLNSDGSVQVTVDADGRKRGKWMASENMPKPADRNIYTSLTGDPASLVAFKTTTGGLSAKVGSDKLVNYIRGDASDEGPGATKLRQRTRNPKVAGDIVSPLGDIVNSSPAFVGSPVNRVYERTKIAGASSYQGHRSTYKDRKQLVYVGANDGMLHAFDAATGKELLAYVPSALLTKLKELAKQDYKHEFYVDGDIVVEDVYNGSSWRTVLVASLGRGGKTLFALDITNPVTTGGAPSVVAATLLWEISGNASNKLGHVLGAPLIAPMNDGTWRVIVGNGYNGSTSNGHLVLINVFDKSDVVTLSTDNVASEGLSGAGGWDDDGDGDVDLLYAGDLGGRLWKFDVSGGNKNKWSAANKAGSQFEPVFNAVDATGAVQPITAPPTVGIHPDTGDIWVFFGTGKFIESADRGNTQVQTWYGVRDKITEDVTSKASRNRDKLTKRIIKDEGQVTRVDGSVGNYRLITGNSAGKETLLDGTHGWYLDLKFNVSKGERMLVRNILLKDILLGSTLIPNTAPCGELGDGWLMAVYPWIGGRPLKDFFDVNGDGDVDENDSINGETVTGYKHGNGGIPYIQRCEEGLCVTGTTTDGEEPPSTVSADDGTVRGRLSWREILGD